MKKIVRYLSILPALFMLFLIFGFSAQNGETSGSLSYRVCLFLLSLFDRIFSWNLDSATFASHAASMQFFVRKAAHITEYFLLTLSIFLPLRVWIPGDNTTKSHSLFLSRYILPTFLLTVLCAAADEFHQSFVPGRCGTPIDVMIDSIGMVIGCLVLIFCHFHIQSKRKQNTTF